MQQFTEPKKFFHAIYDGGAAVLQSENLRIEVTKKREPKLSAKLFKVDYMALINGRWQKFSTFVSPNPQEIVNDALYEMQCYGCCFVTN